MSEKLVWWDKDTCQWVANGEGYMGYFGSEIAAYRWLCANLATAVSLLRARGEVQS